jgi:hypothetical protein
VGAASLHLPATLEMMATGNKHTDIKINHDLHAAKKRKWGERLTTAVSNKKTKVGRNAHHIAKSQTLQCQREEKKHARQSDKTVN